MKPLVALTIIAALAACAHKPEQKQQLPFVDTTIARSGAIVPVSEMSGLIAPYENVAIQTTVVEPADAVNVQEGDHVHKGEVLAQLDTADLVAELRSDEANAQHTTFSGSQAITQGNQTLSAARANLVRDSGVEQRDAQLFRQGYVSEQQLQADQATLRNDQAAVQSAQATVQANGPSLSAPGLQQSAIAQADAQAQQVRVQIAKATIVSPIDGVVVNRNLNVGEYPGTRQIFTLQQISPLFAILRGASAQIVGVAPGSTAQVTVSGTGRTIRLDGKVVGILNQIQPGSTQFQVKVLLENPGEELRPGMAVDGRIDLPVVRGLRIPSTAFTDDNDDAVQIVGSDGVVKTMKVAEVATDGTTSIVTGIAEGDRVVDNGQLAIGDGQKVSYKP